jgi:hypothetical protein
MRSPAVGRCDTESARNHAGPPQGYGDRARDPLRILGFALTRAATVGRGAVPLLEAAAKAASVEAELTGDGLLWVPAEE